MEQGKYACTTVNVVHGQHLTHTHKHTKELKVYVWNTYTLSSCMLAGAADTGVRFGHYFPAHVHVVRIINYNFIPLAFTPAAHL